jgi:Ca2+-binding RTX toxin-like protein
MTTGAFRYAYDAKTIRLTARGFEIGTPDTAHIRARWVVRGTAGDDRPSLANTAAGGTFQALAGNDIFRGSAEDDTFNGGAGTDRCLGMGAGNDTCISIEINNVNDCEIRTPYRDSRPSCTR